MLYPGGIDADLRFKYIHIDDGGNHNGILNNPELYCGPVVLDEVHRAESAH